MLNTLELATVANAVLKVYGFTAVAHSKNQKTGDIAQTYTGHNSCPLRCPFRTVDGENHGCYGENHGTNFSWRRADNGVLDIDGLKQWVKKNVPAGALLRHNIAGDVATPLSSEINPLLIAELCEAFEHVRAFSYTHCAINTESARILRNARARGFVINASCETFEEVDHALALGVPAVLTVTKFYPKGTKTPAGYRLVPCPAQVRDDKQCANCELCARGERNTVICFEVHGSRGNNAAAAIEEKTITFYK